MTVLSPIQALAEKWRRAAKDWEVTGFDIRAGACRLHADELTELLGKVVVDEAMVERSFTAMDAVFAERFPDRGKLDAEDKALALLGIRAAIESALGVTK